MSRGILPLSAGMARRTGAASRVGLVLLAGCAGCLAGLGCRRDALNVGRVVPVEGTVLVNGRPLRLGRAAFGRVWFYPDADRGNSCPQVAIGDIDAEGNYHLLMRGREGAPPGWYKVMVVAVEQIDPDRPSRRRRCLVARRYSAVETSGLRVQVVLEPAAGAYDLKLTP